MPATSVAGLEVVAYCVCFWPVAGYAGMMASTLAGRDLLTVR